MKPSVLPTLILLAALVFLTAAALGAVPVSGPVCGSASALAVLPLGVDWPEGRLAAYGRSAALVRPGDVLCVALAWETGLRAPDSPPTIRVELVGQAGQIGGRYTGPAAEAWGAHAPRSGMIAVQTDRATPEGPYVINLSVVAPGGAPAWTVDGRTAIAIGTVRIDRDAPPMPDPVNASATQGLQFRGRLSEWPFWPQRWLVKDGDA